MIEQMKPLAPPQAFYFRERGDEALYRVMVVADGDDREHIAHVSELYLYPVVVAQQIVDLHAREADLQRIDGELRRVEAADVLAVDYLA